MIIAVSGHRPQKCGGFKIPNPTHNYICHNIERILLEEKPNKVISGMALGVDQSFARIAYKLNIPFIAAIPFVGQQSIWPTTAQELYKEILSLAEEVIIVSKGSYSSEKMQIRNEWMVDRADKILGIWNGTNGGTANCIKYALSLGKEIIIINPLDR